MALFSCGCCVGRRQFLAAGMAAAATAIAAPRTRAQAAKPAAKRIASELRLLYDEFKDAAVHEALAAEIAVAMVARLTGSPASAAEISAAGRTVGTA